MPWRVEKSLQCPASRPWAVIKETDGSIEGCHASEQAAQKQQAALYASEGRHEPIGGAMSETHIEPVREKDDSEVRFAPAAASDLELRDSDGEMPTLAGHFAVFNEWAAISSRFEGEFMERISPGAFSKTFAENRKNMRVLFQHGKDPQVGEKVLGPIGELREDGHGAYYEVPLYDTSYNRDLIPALREGQYGSSFRFRVLQEDFPLKPAEPSEHNPDGLRERTITEAKVMEFGPVTFPAYEGASAGLRSATDWWLEQNLLSAIEALTGRAAALKDEEKPEESTSPVVSRRTRSRDYLQAGKEKPKWQL